MQHILLTSTNAKSIETSPHNIMPHDATEHDVPPPRVGLNESELVLLQTTLAPSSFPKNTRFHNVTDHQCNLRSKTNMIMKHLSRNFTKDAIADHMFNLQTPANHIFGDYGKREKIDSLLAGLHKEVLDISLSNDGLTLAQCNDFGANGTDNIKLTQKPMCH